MTLTALAFAAGAALLQQQGQLPWLAWLALLPLCIGLAALRWRGAAVFALAGGFLWAGACAHSRMADWLSPELEGDRKSTRLNSSHGYISYAVFCLKKKSKRRIEHQPLAHEPDRSVDRRHFDRLHVRVRLRHRL